MNLRSLADISGQRLRSLPAMITEDVADALSLAQKKVFRHAFGRVKRPKPKPTLQPLLPSLFLPPVKEKEIPLQIAVESDSSSSESEEESPPIRPIAVLKTPTPVPTPLPEPQETEPPEVVPVAPAAPVEPIPVANTPDPLPDDVTYLNSRDSVTLGSAFSQRTTEMTHEVRSFDYQPRVKVPKKPAKKPHSTDIDLVKKVNEEWERKQRELADKEREKEALEVMEKRRAAMELELEKQRKLEERRAKIAARRDAALQERLRQRKNQRRTHSVLPLHKRLESEFKAISEAEELEYQRRLLAIREYMQPIQIDALRRHKDWYESQRRKLREERELKRGARSEEIQKYNSERNYYKAKALDILAEEEKAKEEQEAVKLAQPKELHQKQVEYSILVQQLHKPVSTAASKPSTAAGSKRGEANNGRSAVTTSHSPNLSIVEEKKARKRPPKREKSMEVATSNSNSDLSPSPKPLRLKALSKSHPKKTASEVTLPAKHLSERYQNYLRPVYDISHQQKRRLVEYRANRVLQSCSFEELKTETEKLEKRAKRSEALIGRLGRDVDTQIAACDSVSAMYIDSIRAKLQMLGAATEQISL